MYPPLPVTLSHSTFLSYCGEQRQAVCRLGARSSDNSFSTFLLFSVSVSPLCFRGNYWVWERAGQQREELSQRPETGPPAFLSGENRSRPVKRSLA